LLYILYGPDDYSRHQALAGIKKSLGDDVSTGNNVTSIDGTTVNINEFKVACETVPFLAEKRFVLIDGLLERFELRKKPATVKKANRSKDDNNEWQVFADGMKTLPESTILVLIDGQVDKKNPLLKEIADVAQVRDFPLLKYRELPEWIKKRVAQSGARIYPPAVELMAKLVGNDLWAMENEIDKLVLFTAGRVIEEKDVRMIVSHAQETSVFAMVDAIMENKVGLAQELLQQLMQNGAMPAYLLTMLARQLRLAVLIKEMTAQRKAKSEIQTKLALADYAMQKSTEQAEKYPMDKLKMFYEKLLETDIAIKIGKYDDELALNILVVELCQH